MPLGDKPVCEKCGSTTSPIWSNDEHGRVLCCMCKTKIDINKLGVRKKSFQPEEPKREGKKSAKSSFVHQTEPKRKSNRLILKPNDLADPSPSAVTMRSQPSIVKGVSRRQIWKSKCPIKAPTSLAKILVSESIFYNGTYFQCGDIVSLVDEEHNLYYAQLTGFVQDQYCEKGATITWLLPTTASSKTCFEPQTYIIDLGWMPGETELLEFCASGDSVHLSENFSRWISGYGCAGFTYSSFSQEQLQEVWLGLQEICKWQLPNVDGSDPDMKSNACNIALKQLYAICVLAHGYLDFDDAVISDSFVGILVILHQIMNLLPEGDASQKLSLDICKLCEHAKLSHLIEDADCMFGLGPLVYHLTKCLSGKVAVGDAKQIFKLRSLSNAVLTSPHEGQVVLLDRLLKQVWTNLDFIKSCSEARKFLSYLLTLSTETAMIFHESFKEQLPETTKPIQELYGQIYFKAWQSMVLEAREKFEVSCIQDLMHAAIHTSGNLSMQLKHMLHAFHKEKKTSAVDSMLLRLYGPLLLRSAQAPNQLVRQNAGALLLDAFPLRDPANNEAETESLMSKQLNIIMHLLEDECPTTRSETALGVCRMLTIYWEILPASTLRSLISKLFCGLLQDGSSAKVRTAVCKGVMLLMSNALSWPILKASLPSCAKVLHDESETVRIAFIKMLLTVKSLKFMRYHDIVPINELLSRLAIDSNAVARKLTQLVFHSYFPVRKSPDLQLDACMALIETHEVAARRFFQMTHLFATIEQVGVLMLAICHVVLNCAQHEEKRLQELSALNKTDSINVTSRTESEDVTSITADRDKKNPGFATDNITECELGSQSTLTINDSDILVPMLEIAAIMWTSVLGKLKQQSNCKIRRKLQVKFSKALPLVFRYMKDDRSFKTLLVLGSYLPPKAIPAISIVGTSRLKALAPDAEPSKYAAILETMCNWGQVRSILEVIIDWLRPGMLGTPKPTKKRRRVGFQDPTSPQPDLALVLLTYLMDCKVCQARLLYANARQCLLELTSLLEKFKMLLPRRLERLGNDDQASSDAFLVKGFTCYCRLTVLLKCAIANEGKSESADSLPTPDTSHIPNTTVLFDDGLSLSQCLCALIAWFDEHVIDTWPSSDTDAQFHKRLLQSFLDSLRCTAAACELTDEFCEHSLRFCYKLLLQRGEAPPAEHILLVRDLVHNIFELCFWSTHVDSELFALGKNAVQLLSTYSEISEPFVEKLYQMVPELHVNTPTSPTN